MGMMVISQRPARIDKNVLSQCNTQIIMKMTNPNDLKAISKGLEGSSSEVEEELKRLPPGVSILVSNDIELPVIVDIRVKKSKHGGESVKILSSSVPATRSQTSKDPVKPEKSKVLKNEKKEPDKPKQDGSSLFKKLFGSSEDK